MHNFNGRRNEIDVILAYRLQIPRARRESATYGRVVGDQTICHLGFLGQLFFHGVGEDDSTLLAGFGIREGNSVDGVQEVFDIFTVFVIFLWITLEACKLFLGVASYDFNLNK